MVDGGGAGFLPRTDLVRQEVVREIIETEIMAMGHRIYGWRQVPVNVDIIGEKANATRPEIDKLWCKMPVMLAIRNLKPTCTLFVVASKKPVGRKPN